MSHVSTQGSWAVLNRANHLEIRCRAGATLGFAPLAVVTGDKRLQSADEVAAIARLMAGAPKLWESLQWIAKHSSDVSAAAAAQDAIAHIDAMEISRHMAKFID